MTTNFTLDGINYTIEDHDTSGGLTEAQAESMVRNLHTQSSFRTMSDAMASSGEAEDKNVRINIDNPNSTFQDVSHIGGTLDQDGEFENDTISIELKSDSHGDTYKVFGTESGSYPGDPAQIPADMVLVHEFSHLYDYRINDTNLNDASQGEAIENFAEIRTNHVMSGMGIPPVDGLSPGDLEDFRNYHNANGTPVYLDGEDFIPDEIYEQSPERVASGADNDGTTADTDADDVKDARDGQLSESSPLVLDLDGDGIELLDVVSANAVYWDFDNDGFAEAGGWVAPDDGLLALDGDGDGIITDSTELFGDQTGFANGFLALSDHDGNSDGIINSEDAIWSDLVVWTDSDGDAYSDLTEMHTLEELLITQISLSYSDVGISSAGNEIKQESEFTIDGNVRDIADVYFTYSNFNTVYDETYIRDLDTLGLPTLRGYGTLPELHIGMSLDNSGTGSLLGLVDGLSTLTFSDLFDATTDVHEDVRDILFRWADVDGVSSGARGPYVDGRELGFLDAMMGEVFLQRGIHENPLSYAGLGLQEAFDMALNNAYARLLAESAGGELFTGDFYYDIAGDEFSGITGLDSTKLASLETEATALSTTAEKEVFWGNVVRMIEFSVGTTNLPGADQTALDDAITDSDASLDLAGILTSLEFDDNAGSLFNGDSSDNTINGGAANDDIDGNDGNDTLNGLGGEDDINGGAGDDILTGGTGGDYLRGWQGNDEYHYDLGDGIDTIRETSVGTGNDGDEIIFGSGIDSGDLTFTRVGNSDLVIDIDTGTQTGKIVIEDQFNYAIGGGHVEQITFDDLSTYDLDGQNWTTNGTSGDDTLYGVRDGDGGLSDDTIYGGAGDDYINGGAPNEGGYGDDTLYGEAGDDEVYGGSGADVIYGGADDDYLDGGAGDDEIHAGTGDDTIYGGTGADDLYYTSGHLTLTGGETTDTIYLDAAWDSVTPDYYKIGSDLQIAFDLDNTITIDGMFSTTPIHDMVYDDTTTVDLSGVTYYTQGTSSGDTLYGTNGNDVLYGFGGDDTIYGASSYGYGDDTMYGGTGDDHLDGGYGDDYLEGGAGDDYQTGGYGNDHHYYVSGNDTIYDSIGTNDILEIDGSWEYGDLTMARHMTDLYDLRIDFGSGSVNSVTITDMFYYSYQVHTLRLNDGTSDIDLLSLDYTTYGDSGNNTIYGVNNSYFSSGDMIDTIYGDDGNDTIYGYGGGDILYGEGGNDVLYGGDENDTLYGGAGDDNLQGQGGDDLFVYESGIDDFDEYAASNDTIWITNGVDIDEISIADEGSYDTRITINAGTDEILLDAQRYSSYYEFENLKFDDGFETDELLSYGSWMWGTTGNDVSAGNANDNVIIGDDGNDDIDAGAGADDVHGGAGADDIHGDSGADFLHGGAGDDTIYGDSGLDTLWGGDGSDTFMFDSTNAYTETDVIADFDSVNDAIDISDLLSAYDPMTDALSDFVEITDNGTDSTLSVDADGGADSFTAVASILGVTGLTDEAALETSGALITS